MQDGAWLVALGGAVKAPSAACGRHLPRKRRRQGRASRMPPPYGEREVGARLPLIRPCGATFPHGGRLGGLLIYNIVTTRRVPGIF